MDLSIEAEIVGLSPYQLDALYSFQSWLSYNLDEIERVVNFHFPTEPQIRVVVCENPNYLASCDFDPVDGTPFIVLETKYLQKTVKATRGVIGRTVDMPSHMKDTILHEIVHLVRLSKNGKNESLEKHHSPEFWKVLNLLRKAFGVTRTRATWEDKLHLGTAL